MEELVRVSERNSKLAHGIIRQTGVVEAWEAVGAEVRLVGSLKTGLLMNRRDIDFHVYTDPFVLADSFAAIARLAENSRIRRIEYSNLLDTVDKCVEWHAWYADKTDRLWQIDMIHILKGSRYAGYFEKVAERISAVLTPETRRAILEIKNEIPAEEKIPSIEIYRAVIRDGVRDCREFLNWRESAPRDSIIEWMP